MKRPIDGADLAGKLRTRKANAVGHPEAMDAYETAMNDAIDAAELSLNTLRDEVYEDAVAHGLWEENDDPTVCSWLIREEARELDDAATEWADYGWNEEEPDEAFTEELSDIIILCLSVAGHLGIDIDAAVKRKMQINKTRPWKHEGEK